jgi:hypothetical protein
MLRNYMDRDVIPLLSHYPTPAEMADYEPCFSPLDPDTLQAIEEQHIETIKEYDMQLQYETWIESQIKHNPCGHPDDETRRRNREAYRDSPLFERNTWNQFKVIELNSRDNFVPGAVRGI